MKKSRIYLSIFFIILAFCVSVASVCVCIYAVNAEPQMRCSAQSPDERTAEFFDCIIRGNYACAEEYFGTGASLGLDAQPEDVVGKLLFDALRESFSYELCGEYEVNGIEAVQRVEITYLDIPSVTEAQKEPTKQLIKTKVRETEDISLYYDENGAFRHDAAIQILYEATQALLEDAEKYYVTKTIDVELAMRGAQWFILKNDELFRILSGNTCY